MSSGSPDTLPSLSARSCCAIGPPGPFEPNGAPGLTHCRQPVAGYGWGGTGGMALENRLIAQQDVSFGPFRFEIASGRLWSGPQELRLTPKAAAVLSQLVTRPGEPISKQTLFASVWRHRAVSDDALTSCIQELRKALSDDPKAPRFIETRHRRGYRFVARVFPDARHVIAPPYLACVATSGKPTIAVLPFYNIGGDPRRDYFSDGISEDIITALTRHRSFGVISRGSTFAFKGRYIDVREVGRHLGADYIVEGSVGCAGQ